MDINRVLSTLKMEIGIGDYMKTSITDEKMCEWIGNRTVNTFSQYFPHRMKLGEITYNDLNLVRPGIYKLPDRIGRQLKQMEVDVYGIYEIVTEPGGYFGGYAEYPQNGGGAGGGLPFIMAPFSGGDNGLYMGYDYSGLANIHDSLGFQRRKLTAKWIEPDEIEFKCNITDLSLARISITINTTHDKNLSTIPSSYTEPFLKLAKLDLMIMLYNQELQHINDLDVGYGRVVIDSMDKFRNAEDKRDELLKEWDELYLNDVSEMNTMV